MKRYDLENLEPKGLLSWFKKLTLIPHGSYHEKEMSDFLFKTLKESGAKVKQFKSGMILATKPATKGLEKLPVLLLQGHMDMVLAKTKECKKDLLKDHIDAYYDSETDCIRATETSLGADNGIAVAAILEIFTNKKIEHGPLEAVISVNEEDDPGTCVAELGKDELKATHYLNMDGDSINTMIYGGAGCVTMKYDNPIKYIPTPKNFGTYRLEATGFKGGHSGINIHIPHINAIAFIGEILLGFEREFKTKVNIIRMNGGPINNAIPLFCQVDFAMDNKFIKQFEDYVLQSVDLCKHLAQGSEPNMKATAIRLQDEKWMLDHYDSQNIILATTMAPNKVFFLEKTGRCMFSSSNLGFISVDDKTKTFKCDFKVRSFIDTDLWRVAGKIESLMSTLNWKRFIYQGMLSSFINNIDSNTTANTWAKMYRKHTGKVIEKVVCPGGLETATFCAKNPKMTGNAVVVASTIIKEHSPDEAVNVTDTNTFWKILVDFLKELK